MIESSAVSRQRDYERLAWRLYALACRRSGVRVFDWPTLVVLHPVTAQVCRRLWYRYGANSVPMIARSVPPIPARELPRVAWTGGSSEPRAGDWRARLYRELVAVRMREQMADAAEQLTDREVVRIFAGRAKFDAWATYRRAVGTA